MVSIAALLPSACTSVPRANAIAFQKSGKPVRNEDQALAYCRYEEVKVNRIQPRPLESQMRLNSYQNLLESNAFIIACMRNEGYRVDWIGPAYQIP